jgi:phospholipid/cholesterol/gamma-HCH transport system substrate-binding protein
VSDRRTEVRVGLFVIGGIIMLTAVLLLLGHKRHVFEERAKIHATFPDVAGLVVGAPVQIAGVNVGTVSAVAFERNQEVPQIRVDFEIARSSLDLVRADSIARISSQGLLGDKLIDVSPGSRSATAVPPGGHIASAPPPDFDKLLARAGSVMKNLDRVAADAAEIADTLSAPRVREDIRGSLGAVRLLLDATAHGQGLAHAVFYDKRTAQSLTGIAVGLQQLVGRVNGAVAALQPILKSTDKEGRQLLNNLSRAALGLGRVADEVEKSQVLANLQRASEDLAQVTGQLREGKGTLGALVQDPTVYEQLVTILGGIGRSRVLRALVRFAISKDESKEARHVSEPPPGRREGKR